MPSSSDKRCNMHLALLDLQSCVCAGTLLPLQVPWEQQFNLISQTSNMRSQKHLIPRILLALLNVAFYEHRLLSRTSPGGTSCPLSRSGAERSAKQIQAHLTLPRRPSKTRHSLWQCSKHCPPPSSVYTWGQLGY